MKSLRLKLMGMLAVCPVRSFPPSCECPVPEISMPFARQPPGQLAVFQGGPSRTGRKNSRLAADPEGCDGRRSVLALPSFEKGKARRFACAACRRPILIPTKDMLISETEH